MELVKTCTCRTQTRTVASQLRVGPHTSQPSLPKHPGPTLKYWGVVDEKHEKCTYTSALPVDPSELFSQKSRVKCRVPEISDGEI